GVAGRPWLSAGSNSREARCKRASPCVAALLLSTYDAGGSLASDAVSAAGPAEARARRGGVAGGGAGLAAGVWPAGAAGFAGGWAALATQSGRRGAGCTGTV